MKKFIFLLIIPAFLISCEKLKEATMVEFDTNLTLDIPVAVVDPQANALKSATDFDFSKSGTASLLDNPEVEESVNYIESLDIENLELAFTNLEAGKVIKTVSVSITGVGVLATLTDVSSTNNIHNPTVDAAKLSQASAMLKNSKQLTVTVSGTTNEAPMSFTVNMDFDMHIEASPI